MSSMPYILALLLRFLEHSIYKKKLHLSTQIFIKAGSNL